MRASLASAALLLAVSLAGPRALAGPALLFDPADGKVLYAEGLDNQWQPASLTKIMTAYVTFGALKAGKLTLDQQIPYSQKAASQAPGNLGLPVGATLSVDMALKAVIIKSANDVSVMLAEAVAGSDLEFVASMNRTAQRLGMTRTTFVNPNGLPAHEQLTTARDLAKLARAALADYPEYASYWSMPEARVGKRRITTHNGLLNSFDGADGLKTGFICDSGFNVVASATRDGRKLIAVILGEPTSSERTVRAASILEHGFRTYEWKQLFTTASIDTTPIESDAKGRTSMRKSVISWECGTGKRRAVAGAKSKKKSKSAKSKKRSGGAASADTTAETVATNNGTDDTASDAKSAPAKAAPAKVDPTKPASAKTATAKAAPASSGSAASGTSKTKATSPKPVQASSAALPGATVKPPSNPSKPKPSAP